MKINKIIGILTMAFIILAIGIGNVSGQAGPSLMATPALAAPGGLITVNFYEAPLIDSIWIAIYPSAETNNENHGELQYITGLASGTLTFTAPSTPGTYDFRMIGSDPSVAIATSGPITVSAPDLVVTEITVPTISSPGMSFMAGWTVKNIGNANAVGEFGNWIDFVYLSSDTNIDNSDILLEGPSINNPLAPGESYTQSKSVTIPSDTALGDYYILVKTDFYGGVTESNENNNILTKEINISGPVPMIPEKSTILLTMTGLLGILLITRFKRR